MCGIAGIWSFGGEAAKSETSLRGMVSSLIRRGPDAQGTYNGKSARLGHCRLSIIDLSDKANQPMSDESGRYTLVFNGEIYNYKALRRELANAFSTSFKTESDTEVLLRGLIEYGPKFIEKLNGFFAFAFYDEREDHILLARDRYGIKPLFYAEESGQFTFASSLTAVMKGLLTRGISRESLFEYLQFSYIPAPNTILEGVKKLEPAHYVFISKDGVSKTRYYAIPETVSKESDRAEMQGQFKHLLEKSVEDRLQADVPVGTFLSGGLDSAVITHIAAKFKPDITAFSVGFPDNPFFDESPRATAMAKHIGIDHRVLQLSETEIENKLGDILDAIDEPFADSSAVLVNLISEYARREVKVILSGDGADEILGGYNKHRALLRSTDKSFTNKALQTADSLLSVLPESRNSKTMNEIRKLKRYSRGLGLSLADRYLEWASFTPAESVEKLLRHPNNGKRIHIDIDPVDFNTVLRTDMELVLPNDMLCKVDLMSMHHSLEVRVPFLDHHLVNFLFGVPAGEKLNKSEGKILLRDAYTDVMPKNFFSGKKRGFEAPLVAWLAGPLKKYREELFSRELIEKQAIFHLEEVKQLERKSMSQNPGDSPHTIWALLVFQHWYVRHFD